MHRPPRSPLLAILLCLAAGAAGAEEAALAAAQAAPRIAIVLPERLRQGDPLLAWIASSSFAQPMVARLVDASGKAIAKARCFDASAMLAAGEARGAMLFVALFPLPPGLAPGAYSVEAGGASASLSVEARAFPVETIPLDEANTAIKTVPNKRKDEEARRLVAQLAKVDDSAVFALGTTFLFPVEGGFQSAGFGDKRRYIYPKGGSEASVHAGLDWAVVKGTAVRACERGKVVLVADREATGNTIVLEHLPGLYSLYFHLSSAEVAEGRIVERGERIALSGSTGMSTGPHLHWELRARGDAVDPQFWLGPALLDKAAIIARITALIEGG